MHRWSEASTQRNRSGGVCCRFEDAASLCRPAKGLLHEEAMDWHWWLAAQAAFHTGDLQQVSSLRPAVFEMWMLLAPSNVCLSDMSHFIPQHVREACSKART